MGNSHKQKIPFLPSPEEISRLVRSTGFSRDELEVLYTTYRRISQLEDADGLIDEQEFKKACGWEESEIARRIFHLFDTNSDKVVNFEEFATGMAVFHGTDMDKKIEFSFRLYDLDDNGYIDKQELLGMLRASLLENCVLGLSESQLKKIIDYTFLHIDANHDDKISFEEYKALVKKYPSVLEDFKLDFRKKQGLPQLTEVSESTY